MRSVFSLMAASALLAACGGSDDNNNGAGNNPGTTVPAKGFLTSANYVGVAQTALQTNAYVLNISDLVFGVQVTDPQMLVKLDSTIKPAKGGSFLRAARSMAIAPPRLWP